MENKLDDNTQKLINFLTYFPVKFFYVGAICAYILFYQFESIKFFEEQILFSLYHFFGVPALFMDGILHLGGSLSPIEAAAPLYSQTLYLLFFPTLAISTKAKLDMKIQIALWGLVCFFCMIITQFISTTVIFSLGFASDVSIGQLSFLLTAVVGAIIIEISIFSVLTLPPKNKVKLIFHRKRTTENIFFVLFILGTFLTMYFMLNFFRITTDSPIAAYVGLNITTLMAFRFYLTFFVAETKLPQWIQKISTVNQDPVNSISFVIPCYNEEAYIKRCIHSADMAAANFSGKTEILVVNDGSTDKTKPFIEEAMKDLKFSTGKFFNIKNTGKGFALKLALDSAKGEIIFRLDADSMVDKDAIAPVMRHFRDPSVASVSGMILPIEEKSFWQRAQVLVGCSFLFYKRGQEVVNSILCQPGSFSVFRKEALEKTGGWSAEQFGEDAEVTVRLNRSGYRNEFEQNAQVVSEAPLNFKEFRIQRLRWNLGYYHARAKNMEFLKGVNGASGFVYIFSVMSHGIGFAAGLYWAYLAALIAVNPANLSFDSLTSLTGLPIQLGLVETFFFILHFFLYVYFLHKFKRLHYIKYLPFLRVLNLIQAVIVKPEALEILLKWSSKWKKYTPDSYHQLRKDMMG